MQVFAERVAMLMNDQGISQAELCRRSGVKSSAMSNYLNNKSEPSLPTTRKIADALGVRVDVLAGLAPMPDKKKTEFDSIWASLDARDRDVLLVLARKLSGDEERYSSGHFDVRKDA